jgi:two-component system, OmpR family, sensor kinase
LTLQRRLTLFTVALTTFITIVLGLTLVESTYRSQINSFDYEINQIAQATINGKDSSITEALTFANSSRNNLSLLVLDQNGEILPILEQGDDLSDSLKKVIDIEGKLAKKVSTYGNYRIRGIDIGGGDRLLVVADLTTVESEKNRNYLLLTLFLIISSLLSLSLLRRVIARDVKRAIAEIQALDRLQSEQEKNRLLKNFIADASHELRTPLTVIKGYLELWKKNPNLSPDPQKLELMLTESMRMDKNITSLLKFLEQETTNEATLMPINLSTILDRELHIFDERESNRAINELIENDLLVLGTEELLLTVLRNIFSNIARHSDSHAKVIIRAFKRKNEVFLQFENQWSAQLQDALDFEKLTTRFSATRSFEKGGSGLGFSIMNSAVAKMRGNLKVYKSDEDYFGVEVILPAI